MTTDTNAVHAENDDHFILLNDECARHWPASITLAQQARVKKALRDFENEDTEEQHHDLRA